MPQYDTRGRDRAIVDPLLTRISVGWSVNNQMVGDVLFQPVRTNEQSGRYYNFGREAFTPYYDGMGRAPGASANETEGARIAEDNYFCTEDALKQIVTDEEVELYGGDVLNPRQEATENVTSKIVLGRELEIHNMVTDPTNYIPDHVTTLGSGDQFQDHDTSNPVELFRDLFRVFHRTLHTLPNVAIIPFQAMTYLEDHPRIVERYQAQGGVMNAAMIASLLGMQRIYVPGGAYNEAGNPARPDSISYMWDTDIVLAWVPPRPGRKIPAFGYEFVWPIRGQNRLTDRWYDVDHVGEWVRVRTRRDLKFIATDEDTNQSIAGMLIRNAISEEAANGAA